MKNTKSVLRYPFLLVAAVLALSTLTCTITIGGQTPAPPPTPILLLPPTVTPTVQPPQVTFTGDRTIVKGECATLQWSVQGDGVLAVKLNGQLVNPSGQQQVCPQESTLYTLSVETGTAVIQREVRIFVEAGPLPLPPPLPAPGPSVAADPYADHVVNFTPGNPANPDLGNAQSVLGPPDFNESALSGFLTLGVGGSVTVEFVDNLAVDGSGPDLELVGDPGNDEQWIAEVSADGVSYRSFGKVRERATLDLAKVGLTSARFVRLTDDGDPSGGISPGSELDAVVALNSAAPGAAPPPLTPILLPSADPAVTDLYPDSLPTGKVWGRITNHGPDSLTNTDIQLSCSTVRTEYVGGAQTTQAVAPRTITVNLNAGQTAAFDTHIPIEDSTKYWYKVTCSIQVWAANLNTNTSNDSYTESIPPPP